MNSPVSIGEIGRRNAVNSAPDGDLCPSVCPSGPSILDVMTDPELLGSTFAGPTWARWRVVLAGAFGLPLSNEDVAVFHLLAGRNKAGVKAARELWVIIGRRGGKSMIAALVAVYLTCFRAYRLAPGETGTFKIIAPDRRQCRVIKGYIAGLLRSSELLAPMIASDTKDAIALTNGLVIEVQTASFKTSRGYTVVGCVIDEAAFLPHDDSAEPDKAILAAVRPAMATVADAMLMVISSPYSRRGEVFRTYSAHFGKDDDPVLVIKADSKSMNPSIPDHVIAAAYEQDEAAARAEYGGEFRSDVEDIFTLDALSACVIPGRRELPPVEGITYRAFVDPSGGSADAFTMAIAHTVEGVAVLDAVRERRPPFPPDDVVSEYAALLRSYRITKVTGDRYAGEWPRERFAVHGIHYDPSARPKSDLYLALLPLINSKRVELLDLGTPQQGARHGKLVTQLSGLERRTGRGGRDSVDHAPNEHDDVANAVAGVLTAGAEKAGPSIRPLFDDEEWDELTAYLERPFGSLS